MDQSSLQIIIDRVSLREEEEIVEKFRGLLGELSDEQRESLNRESLGELLARARSMAPTGVALQRGTHRAEELRFNS